MATEYKLPYTGSELDQKLKKIDEVAIGVNEVAVGVDKVAVDVELLKNYVTPEMFGAKCDGVTDDTNAIILAMQTGKPVYFKNKGTYRIQGIDLQSGTEFYGNGCTILFSGYNPPNQGAVGFGVIEKHNIIIDGFTLIPQNHSVADIYVTNSTSIKITNCDIQGNSIADNIYHTDGAAEGIAIRGSKYITVENCNVQNIYSQGIPISHSSSHITISKCRFENIGRGGIYVMGGNTDINICDNKLFNCVKYFTVADGAIDVYGDPQKKDALRNDTIRIVGNYIEGFGRNVDDGDACGIIIKGVTNVVCSENTIKTDENTKICAGIFVQDRNGVNVSDCIIKNNYILIDDCIDSHWTEGSEFAYLIRLFDIETMKNITVSGNTLKSTHRGVTGLSLRGKFENLLINDNYIDVVDYYGVNSVNLSDFIKKNVRIINNTIEGRLYLAYCNGIYVYDNKITYNASNNAPLRFVNSDDGRYGRNHIYGNDENHVSLSVCENITDGGDNVFYDKDGWIVDVVDDSSPIKISESSNITIENIYKLSSVDIKCFGDIVFDVAASTDNIVDYQIFNNDGTYQLIIDGTTYINDSVKKLALKTTSITHANYKNENGDMYVSDYRDWKNGVDWHLLHEVILTGDEAYYESGFPAIALRKKDEYRPKPAGGDYNLYKTPYISNFYYDDNTYPIYSPNNSYIQIYDTSYEHGFESLDAFKSYCREMYTNGTPLKIVYLLETPYTTPIPEDELLAYNNVNIGEGTIITNNFNKPFKTTYLTNNDIVMAIDEMINQNINNNVSLTEDKAEHICTITTDGVNKIFSITDSIGNIAKLNSMIVFVKLPAGCVSSEVSGWGRLTFRGSGYTISSTRLNGVGGDSDKEAYFIIEVFTKNKIWRTNYTLAHTGTAYNTALYGDVLSQIENPKYCDDNGYKYIDAIEFNNVPREGIEIKVFGTKYKQN